MLSRPPSFSLQASSSSWLAKICRSSSFSRHSIDTGMVLGQPAVSDRSSGSGSWKVKTIQNAWLPTAIEEITTLFLFRTTEEYNLLYSLKIRITEWGHTCVRAASWVLAAGACLIAVGMDNRVEDGMKSGVDKWSTGSPSSQCCSCSMLLKQCGDTYCRLYFVNNNCTLYFCGTILCQTTHYQSK